MNSFMPRLHEYPISALDTKRVHRNTSREVSIRLAAERWTLRSPTQRRG